MKSILERALVHLLNEENDKAEELLHQFVIETARNIHETLREGDEENLDDDALEEDYFGQDDLEADDAAGADDAAADLGDDLGADVPAEADAGDMSDDTLDGEGDLDGLDGAEDADGGDIDSEIENFEQELADLQAKFDAMLAEIEGEDDLSDDADMDADAEMDADADMNMDADADASADMADEDSEFSDEDLVKEDVDFDDITESVVDELQKVAAIEAEGKGATGQDLQGNKQSLKFNRPEAKPTNAPATARVGHTGYARETAPSSTAQKGGKTVVSTKMKNVRDNGDVKTPQAAGVTGNGASIKKPAPDAAHAKSPLSTKPKK